MMRASLTKARFSRRVALTVPYSSPTSILATRTFASTSRRCNSTSEDAQPLRFSDFKDKVDVENKDNKPDTPANTAPQDKPVFTKDDSKKFITYTPRGAATGFQIERQEKRLIVTDLATGKKKSFHARALRDACNCSLCRDKTSGNKNFSQAQIPPKIAFRKVVPEVAGLNISFISDFMRKHGTFLSRTKLEAAMKEEPPMMGPRIRDQLVQKTGIVSWDRETISQRVRTIDYAEFAEGKAALWSVITDLSRYGLVFLKNVPPEQDSIEKITTRIANIKETFYGRTFDVKAKPNAENVAYTSGYLGLHQDLLYLESPPQIQILHCLENSCSGGESLFADGDRIGRAMLAATAAGRSERQALGLEIPYRYDKNGYYYMQQRPFMKTSLAPNGKEKIFETMWWSPPFAAPDLKADQNRMQLFGLTQVFERAIHAEENMYERKMEPGECVLFDNRRVMHGRRAFDAESGGSRWLRGSYISEEDFLSKASYLQDSHARATRGDAVRSRAEADKEVADSALVKKIREELTSKVTKSPQSGRKTTSKNGRGKAAAAAVETVEESGLVSSIKDDHEAAVKGAQRFQRLQDGENTVEAAPHAQEKVETEDGQKPEVTASAGQL